MPCRAAVAPRLGFFDKTRLLVFGSAPLNVSLVDHLVSRESVADAARAFVKLTKKPLWLARSGANRKRHAGTRNWSTVQCESKKRELCCTSCLPATSEISEQPPKFRSRCVGATQFHRIVARIQLLFRNRRNATRFIASFKNDRIIASSNSAGRLVTDVSGSPHEPCRLKYIGRDRLLKEVCVAVLSGCDGCMCRHSCGNIVCFVRR